MKVVFNKNVVGVAKRGDVKDVAEGFARNFLIPNGLATAATQGAMRSMSQKQKSEETRVVSKIKGAKELAKKLKGFRLTFKAKADDTGKLYGSINAEKISQELQKIGLEVSTNQVKLTQPIKKIGNHPVSLQFEAKPTEILVIVNKE